MLEVAATSVLSRLAHHSARPVRGPAPTPPPLVSNYKGFPVCQVKLSLGEPLR
jgi:hypothetical protein